MAHITGFINGYKSFIRWATNNEARKKETGQEKEKRKRQAKNKNNRVVAKTPFWHEDWGNQFSPIESQRPNSKNFWKLLRQEK